MESAPLEVACAIDHQKFHVIRQSIRSYVCSLSLSDVVCARLTMRSCTDLIGTSMCHIDRQKFEVVKLSHVLHESIHLHVLYLSVRTFMCQRLHVLQAIQFSNIAAHTVSFVNYYDDIIICLTN